MAEEHVSLREITAESLRAVLALEVGADQRDLVAPNSVSIAQAHFAEDAWFRAIYAGDAAVGFVMLAEQPERGHYYVWRFMIAGEHQGRGYGREAMRQVIERVRTLPKAHELLLSYVPDPGNAGPFYAKLGFEETGREEDGERVMSLPLAPRQDPG